MTEKIGARGEFSEEQVEAKARELYEAMGMRVRIPGTTHERPASWGEERNTQGLFRNQARHVLTLEREAYERGRKDELKFQQNPLESKAYDH